jgi:predicted ATPase
VIVQALGLREPGRRALLEGLKEYLRSRSLLLLLDNFEHVVTAAPLVAELLAKSRGLRVLVTSRAPLRLCGEHEYGMSPLALPDVGAPFSPSALTRCAAVTLFVERSAASSGGTCRCSKTSRYWGVHSESNSTLAMGV